MSDDNARLDRKLYKYPASDVLRNKLDIRDAATLENAERELVRERIEQGVPPGDFDLNHLKAIHRHLFQDVYPWAGEIRKTLISKGHAFMHPDRIETGMADVHRRIVAQGFFKGRTADQFAASAAKIISDINHCHPFREGNGRTQLIYLQQLGACAGHRIDLTRFKRKTWIAASIASHAKSDQPMANCIRDAIISPHRSQSQPLRITAPVRREAGSADLSRHTRIARFKAARDNGKTKGKGLGD